MRKLIWLLATMALVLIVLVAAIALPQWAQRTPRGARDAIFYAGKLPHPYLGYITKPQQFRTPLWSEDPYAFMKPVDRSKIRVGILGGSVAHQLYQHWVSSPEIQTRLQKILAARLSHQGEIELIELCAGGWYHPQTLIAALFYGRGLDLAISLEGGNELTRGVNTFPMEFPQTKISNIFFSHTFGSHLALLFADGAMAISFQLQHLQDNGIFPGLSAALNSSFLNLSRKILAKWHVPQRRLPFNYEAVTDLWDWSLRKQSLFFREENTAHLVFVQPILCIAGAKDTQSAQEKGACHNDAYNLWPRMIQAFKQKPAYKKLGITDFSRYFRAEKREVFLDDLHLNSLGLELLTNGILDKVARSPEIHARPARKIKTPL